MAELVKVANVSEVTAGKAKTVNAKGTAIALYNVAGKFYATQNNCLHRSGPLGDGQLNSDVVTCPWHGWQYDVKDGQNKAIPTAKLKVYRTEVKGEEVYVEV